MATATTSAPEITVGVIGSGSVSDTALTALLQDYFADKSPTFVVPVTKTHLSDEVDIVLDFATEANASVISVTDASTARNRSLRDTADSTEQQFKTDNVPQKLIDLVQAGVGERQLFLLWSGADDEAAMLALEAADEAGIVAFDLCDGLQPIHLSDGEADEVDPEEVSAPESAPEVTDEVEVVAEEPAEEPVRRGRKPLEAVPDAAESPAEPPKRRGRPRKTPEPQVAAEAVVEEVVILPDEGPQPAPRSTADDVLDWAVDVFAGRVAQYVIGRMKAEQLVTPKRSPGRPPKSA